MGMFNWVKYEAKCKECGKELNGFQTKDGNEECTMKTVKPEEIDHFYTICRFCNAFHDFEVERVCVINNITVTIREEN